MCIGSSLRASSSGQANPLALCGPKGGWQKPEQKGTRAGSRVGSSSVGKKAGAQFAGPDCEEWSGEAFRTP